MTKLILQSQSMSLIQFSIQMEEAYVFLRKIPKDSIQIMPHLLKVKKKKASIDFGQLQDLSKTKTVNMITKSKSLTPLSWVELDLESRTFVVINNKCLKPNCTNKSYEKQWKSNHHTILTKVEKTSNAESAGVLRKIQRIH